MSDAAIALGIVALVLVAVIGLSSASGRGFLMSPEQYMLGGRTFGALLLWILMAGEIYTSFTFLGAAGWAYGKGAPAFYIMCYGPIAYIVSYFLLPPLWRVARRFGLLTGPDFFAQRYGSKGLGVMVAVIGFVFLIPYVTLQLTGLQILLRIAGYGAVDATAAVALAFMLTALFVFTAGLRGLAWASVAKDGFVLAAVLFVGVALPLRFFGSPARVIDRVLDAHPQWMTLTTGGDLGTAWFVSTVILTALGFWTFPQSFAAAYSARSDDALRRNAVFLPLYNVLLLLVFFAGFAALVVMPGLRGTQADQSFMLVVQRYYPPWVLGLVAAAGCLAALVPASAQLLGAASIVSKNVLGDWLGLATQDRERTRATRILVVVLALLALGFWTYERTTIVNLLLLAYSGMTQFFPGLVLAFCWRRTTAWGVGAGILAGIAFLGACTALHVSTLWGMNTGFVALVLNAVACIAVSLISRPLEAAVLDRFDEAATGRTDQTLASAAAVASP